MCDFSEDSILKNPHEASCEEIFNALCLEIALYYKPLGGKFAKSGPHITFKKQNLTLKLCFWSSSFNVKGEHVNLEVIPNFYCSLLPDKKGYFFGYPAVFNTSEVRAKNNFNVYGVTYTEFLEIISLIDNYILTALDAFLNYANTNQYLATIEPKLLQYALDNNTGLNAFLKTLDKC